MALDFTFSEEQEFFRQTVRDTVNRLIMPKVAELDEKEEFPEPRIFTPKDYGVEDIVRRKTAVDRKSAVIHFGEEERPYDLPSLDLLNLPKSSATGPDREETIVMRHPYDAA